MNRSGRFLLAVSFVLMALLGLIMASRAVDGAFAFAGYVFTAAGILLTYQLLGRHE